MPKDIAVIDLMLAIPAEDNSKFYEWIKPMLMDRESHEMFQMPAQYMFKDIPETPSQDDYIAYTIAQMDKHGIERAMIDVGDFSEAHAEALRRHPERFFASYEANPNKGMDEVRNLIQKKTRWRSDGARRWRMCGSSKLFASAWQAKQKHRFRWALSIYVHRRHFSTAPASRKIRRCRRCSPTGIKNDEYA